MRRLIVDTIMSLDGYYTDPNNSIDWFDFDGGENEWSTDILRRVDTIIFGRRTYEEFSTFWPTSRPKANGFEPEIIQRLNELPKIVISKSLVDAPWKPVVIERGNPDQMISKLKEQSGEDMVLLGSGSLVAALARDGLIDEYRVRIRPIILGAGRPLFEDRNARHPLKLVSSKVFENGVLAVHYEPILS
jgi:dihydrofolate reductase